MTPQGQKWLLASEWDSLNAATEAQTPLALDAKDYVFLSVYEPGYEKADLLHLIGDFCQTFTQQDTVSLVIYMRQCQFDAWDELPRETLPPEADWPDLIYLEAPDSDAELRAAFQRCQAYISWGQDILFHLLLALKLKKEVVYRTSFSSRTLALAGLGWCLQPPQQTLKSIGQSLLQGEQRSTNLPIAELLALYTRIPERVAKPKEALGLKQLENLMQTEDYTQALALCHQLLRGPYAGYPAQAIQAHQAGQAVLPESAAFIRLWQLFQQCLAKVPGDAFA